jgi:hypothetical protein
VNRKRLARGKLCGSANLKEPSQDARIALQCPQRQPRDRSAGGAHGQHGGGCGGVLETPFAFSRYRPDEKLNVPDA